MTYSHKAHNAYRLALDGQSMRDPKTVKDEAAEPEGEDAAAPVKSDPKLAKGNRK